MSLRKASSACLANSTESSQNSPWLRLLLVMQRPSVHS
jgi:hypothetical protein